MNDNFLDQLQSDVFAILSNTPSLSLARKILDDKGSLEGEIENQLATINDESGKCGLAVIVLAAEVEKADENLPGPPLHVRVDVQTLEMVELNRNAGDGTLIRSATAAVRVIAALHHVPLGSCVLYGGKDPIRPLPLRPGFVGHIVSVRTRVNGAFVVPRPLGVEVAMAGAVRITGSLTNSINSITFPDLLFDQIVNGGDYYVATISGGSAELVFTGSVWLLQYSSTFPNQSAFWIGAGTANTPPENITWEPDGDETGTPILARVAGNVQLITLTCDSPSSTIRYTTDGSYPSPAKTLYTAPLTGLAVGTVVRAAAYVAAMPPGDVLEFTVTD